MVNALLQVRHEDKISGSEPSVMQSVVVDVAKHSLSADTVSVVHRVNVSTQFLHIVFRLVFVILIILKEKKTPIKFKIKILKKS